MAGRRGCAAAAVCLWLFSHPAAPVEVRQVHHLDFANTSWDEVRTPQCRVPLKINNPQAHLYFRLRQFQRLAFVEHVPVLLTSVPDLGSSRPGWLTHVADLCPDEECAIHQMEEDDTAEWAGLNTGELSHQDIELSHH